MVMYDKNDLPPNWNNFKNCIAANNLRNYDFKNNFKLKYPLGTIHFQKGSVKPGKARQMIDALLVKYADQGITAIDDIGDLRVSPFNEFGTPVEIVDGIFGGRDKYLTVIKELQIALYTT